MVDCYGDVCLFCCFSGARARRRVLHSRARVETWRKLLPRFAMTAANAALVPTKHCRAEQWSTATATYVIWRDAVRGSRWGLEYPELLRDICASELTSHIFVTRNNLKTCSG